jgi:hypothetical protein
MNKPSQSPKVQVHKTPIIPVTIPAPPPHTSKPATTPSTLPPQSAAATNEFVELDPISVDSFANIGQRISDKISSFKAETEFESDGESGDSIGVTGIPQDPQLVAQEWAQIVNKGERPLTRHALHIIQSLAVNHSPILAVEAYCYCVDTFALKSVTSNSLHHHIASLHITFHFICTSYADVATD